MIYFVRNLENGRIKIGTTTNLDHRLRMLAIENRAGLQMIAITDGGRAEEKALHDRFAAIRVEGEWFQPGPDLLDFITQDVGLLESPLQVNKPRDCGRKSLTGERRSDTPLRIRLTDEERETLDSAAIAINKATSAWARDILLVAADIPRPAEPVRSRS